MQPEFNENFSSFVLAYALLIFNVSRAAVCLPHSTLKISGATFDNGYL